MLWGNTLNFTTHDFAKGSRTLNMVMTFVSLHDLTITLLLSLMLVFLSSLLEGLSMDFPSHVIISIIDIYHDIATSDKLIFPLTITRIITHMHIAIPSSPLFTIIGAISKESMQRSAT